MMKIYASMPQCVKLSHATSVLACLLVSTIDAVLVLEEMDADLD